MSGGYADPGQGSSGLALDGEHVDEADVRILGEELWTGRGGRGRDLAGEVGLPRGLVLKCVEDPERRVVHAEAVPDARAWLTLHDPLPRLEEGLDFGLLAGLRLDEGQDSQGQCHGLPPCSGVGACCQRGARRTIGMVRPACSACAASWGWTSRWCCQSRSRSAPSATVAEASNWRPSTSTDGIGFTSRLWSQAGSWGAPLAVPAMT